MRLDTNYRAYKLAYFTMDADAVKHYSKWSDHIPSAGVTAYPHPLDQPSVKKTIGPNVPTNVRDALSNLLQKRKVNEKRKQQQIPKKAVKDISRN